MSVSAPPLDPSIAFALLASGRSQRFGGSKLDAVLAGTPLWRWAAGNAEAAGFTTRLLIVHERPKPEVLTMAKGWSVVVNSDADDGMASSIRTACSAAAECSRLVIGLADMPFIDCGHLRDLALAAGVAFTRYPSGREGVPAGFPRDALRRLAKLDGDHGAASLDWGSDKIAISPRSPDSLVDIDTPQDLDRAHALLAAR